MPRPRRSRCVAAPPRTARFCHPCRVENRRAALLALALAAATLFAFAGVLDAGFVEYDDDLYVTERPEIVAGLGAEGWHWAWTSSQGANWFPLTRLSWQLDAELMGLDPAGFHATSLVLHVATALLLLWGLWRLSGQLWASAFVAAVFALHPLHVESVAWVSARKDVLSGLCFAVALLLHERVARGPHPGRWRAALFAAMALGLLAKPMLVTLPCVLLLLDYWPLGRLGDAGRFDAARVRRAVVEKLPLFALAAAASVVTLWAQREGGALQGLAHYPFGMRVEAALDGLLRYLAKSALPVDLAVFYPHPRGSVPLWRAALGLALLLGTTAVAWRVRRSAPQLLVGWLWFVGMLVPVSGLVQVGQAALADRYTYLPLIGLAIALAWSVRAGLAGLPRARPVVAILAVSVLCALGVASAAQVRTWRDGESLFRHALRVTRSNGVAHTNLALVLARDGRLAEAETHLDAAVELSPGSAIAWGLRGEVRAAATPARAAQDFRVAVRLDPRSPRWRTGLGRALADTDPEAAEASLRAALALHPEYPVAHAFLGALLLRGGRVDEAAAHYERALADGDELARALGPAGLARAQAQLAVAYARLGRPVQAVAAYDAALAHGERTPEVLNNLAWLLATGGPAVRNPTRALALAREAEAAAGGDPSVLDTLARAQSAAGREAEALVTARRALALAEDLGRPELARALRARFPDLTRPRAR